MNKKRLIFAIVILGYHLIYAQTEISLENYRGSFLYKSEDEVDTYILMDTWITKQSYEDFKKINQKTYNEISAGFEYLYLTEEKTGSFNAVQ